MAINLKRWILENKKHSFYITIELILLVLVVLFLPQYLNSLGPEETVIIFWITFTSELVILSVLLAIIAFLILDKIFDKKINVWVKATICIMVLFLIVGTNLILYNFGDTQLSLVLRNSDNIGQIIGNITCEDDSGKLIVGYEINCEIEPKISIISANVTFTFHNDSKLKEDFYNRSFVVPDNCNYIYFRIVGIDENNETLKLEISYPISFYTEKENEKRNETYIGLIILLFGAVLFSVPSMMNNFKNLSKG